jgi:hypothetical protein
MLRFLQIQGFVQVQPANRPVAELARAQRATTIGGYVGTESDGVSNTNDQDVASADAANAEGALRGLGRGQFAGYDRAALGRRLSARGR